MSMLDDVRIAQRDAGEAAVIANLERLGLVPKTASPLELMTAQRDDLLKFAKLVLRGLESGAVKAKPIIDMDPEAEQLEMRPLEVIARAAIAKAQGGAA